MLSFYPRDRVCLLWQASATFHQPLPCLLPAYSSASRDNKSLKTRPCLCFWVLKELLQFVIDQSGQYGPSGHRFPQALATQGVLVGQHDKVLHEVHQRLSVQPHLWMLTQAPLQPYQPSPHNLHLVETIHAHLQMLLGWPGSLWLVVSFSNALNQGLQCIYRMCHCSFSSPQAPLARWRRTAMLICAFMLLLLLVAGY